jgi:hypothetical protein
MVNIMFFLNCTNRYNKFSFLLTSFLRYSNRRNLKFNKTRILLFNNRIYKFLNLFLLSTLKKLSFVVIFYKRNELIWNDGFLIDFLQKKTIDLYVRKFIVFTGFLFSERLVFDTIIKLYLENLIWPAHKYSIFEVNNVAEMFSIILSTILVIFILFYLVFILF